MCLELSLHQNYCWLIWLIKITPGAFPGSFLFEEKFSVPEAEAVVYVNDKAALLLSSFLEQQSGKKMLLYM